MLICPAAQQARQRINITATTSADMFLGDAISVMKQQTFPHKSEPSVSTFCETRHSFSGLLEGVYIEEEVPVSVEPWDALE